eukprot:TRINITY_DN3101_c0_g2_i1.p1 TRINITY_DN3101_c0_g2~~TRINITY_DN3101_c0_g2_i1.p1  ORF type:complete len:166 (-),score=36.71 TRINITY_DN3101_c0_g2_i1:33-530(-)
MSVMKLFLVFLQEMDKNNHKMQRTNDELEPELVDEYTAAFRAKVKGNAVTSVSSLGTLLRHVGMNLPPVELAQKLQQYGGNMTLDSFLDMMHTSTNKEDTQEDILEAFTVFDKDGNGNMQINELRFVLTAMGDKLDLDVSDEIISSISTRDGQFNYRSLVADLQS